MATPPTRPADTATTAAARVPNVADPPQPAPLAQLLHVGKRFGATAALTDVSLTITPGTSHALVGRNGAGKSTLVGILTGILTPDTGQVLIDGTPAPTVEQRDARTAVACVYQRPKILPDLTVAENLLLGEELSSHGLIRWRHVHRRAAAILEQWNVPVRPTTLARDLTVEQRQLVEIARALSRGSRLVILDEPTAQLDRRASSRLFDQMRKLQSTDVTFLFISHHLHEVYDVCQDVTVLRDGRHVTSGSVTDLPLPQLVRAMVGDATAPELQTATHDPAETAAPAARADNLRTAPVSGSGEPMLRLDKLTLAGSFRDINLHVEAGEILSVAGLTSSGKAELADTIVGLHRPTAGTIMLRGRPLRPGRIDRAIAAGIGYVPEDRHARGFAPQLSIAENLTSSITGRLGRAGIIRRSRRTQIARQLADRLEIVPTELRTPVSDLSGGNQQKVVMGRALARAPILLVLINPTAGVDIASKEALYNLVQDVRRDGTAVLLITDEIDELALGDRAVVMFDGQLTAHFSQPWQPRDLVAAIEGVHEHEHPPPASTAVTPPAAPTIRTQE